MAAIPPPPPSSSDAAEVPRFLALLQWHGSQRLWVLDLCAPPRQPLPGFVAYVLLEAVARQEEPLFRDICVNEQAAKELLNVTPSTVAGRRWAGYVVESSSRLFVTKAKSSVYSSTDWIRMDGKNRNEPLTCVEEHRCKLSNGQSGVIQFILTRKQRTLSLLVAHNCGSRNFDKMGEELDGFRQQFLKDQEGFVRSMVSYVRSYCDSLTPKGICEASSLVLKCKRRRKSKHSSCGTLRRWKCPSN
eukprot:TRINITY_DN10469_c0_g1_i2.p1 TRINITY_DN10469_c0_g1~~TRINITY_DN10469_c0_g1_i2.p1  ORF type:complete len:265 (-),score=68.90 TRINITY_DN10469_c0_g1_i2:744-1478(-)